MILYINTVSKEEIIIALKNGPNILASKKILAYRDQAEKLLPGIDRLLRDKKIKLTDLTKIIVANRGGSFTALRIGVITANALAYALKIPIESEPKSKISRGKFNSQMIIKPIYDREPNIGVDSRTVKSLKG